MLLTDECESKQNEIKLLKERIQGLEVQIDEAKHREGDLQEAHEVKLAGIMKQLQERGDLLR